MITFDTFNLHTQIEETVKHIAAHEGVAIENATYPGQNLPLYKVHWGGRPTKCEKGRPIFYGWIVGDSEQVNSNCDNQRQTTFQIGIALSDQENAIARKAWNAYWNRLQTVLGIDGMAIRYNSTLTIGLFDGTTQTQPANWSLGDLGIFDTSYTGGNQRQIGGDCGFYIREMLVTWTMYFCKRQSTIRNYETV